MAFTEGGDTTTGAECFVVDVKLSLSFEVMEKPRGMQLEVEEDTGLELSSTVAGTLSLALLTRCGRLLRLKWRTSALSVCLRWIARLEDIVWNAYYPFTNPPGEELLKTRILRHTY